jgi:hypothetical protein
MTGIEAALSPEMVATVPKSQAGSYKSDASNNTLYRRPLNLSETDGTLRPFKERFAKGDLFRSPSEICDIYLVPDGSHWNSDSTAQSSWYGDDFALVGDNTRERPYVDLYNRITTRSNVFTVHYRAQALKQSTANLKADPTLFDTERGDRINAEQRGSSTFERYLTPADARFNTGAPASFLANPASSTDFSLETYYRTRILNSKVFTP